MAVIHEILRSDWPEPRDEAGGLGLLGEFGSAADVGGTPLERIRMRIAGTARVVHLKLEGHNPSGSIKDRTALSLLRELEVSGRLPSQGRLVESSSGNLAVALALFARDRGHAFTAVVDPKITAENLARLHELGAEVRRVDALDDSGGYLMTRLALVREMLAEDPGLVWTNQYANAANPLAHFTGTAPEIYRQMDHEVDAVFVAVSTGGTLAGTARYFRETSPHTRVIAVDARGSVALGGTPGTRKLTGMGSSRRSELATSDSYDELVYVGDAEAFAFCRALDASTGIKVGGSSGACLAACAGWLERNPRMERAVCIAADRGEHYASSIFSDAWLLRNGVALGTSDLGPASKIHL
ncbi:MAG: pyridoxal-phosphate dependent enzyme [Deltaproteobacteria bacterium]|nr:pyridoxal-phosphate dependent enzyme [Deltaproteobacteria bacterium]MBW2421977.1 pyridoxal-phosphate dependent enzyme [Deltaproteobacteria bacterium]